MKKNYQSQETLRDIRTPNGKRRGKTEKKLKKPSDRVEAVAAGGPASGQCERAFKH